MSNDVYIFAIESPTVLCSTQQSRPLHPNCFCCGPSPLFFRSATRWPPEQREISMFKINSVFEKSCFSQKETFSTEL